MATPTTSTTTTSSDIDNTVPKIAALSSYVTRWNPFIEQNRGNIPLIFLDYWAQIESNGEVGPSTNYPQNSTASYVAKGIGQLNADEYKSIGFDADKAVNDGEYALLALIAFINKICMPAVDAAIAKYGMSWAPFVSPVLDMPDLSMPNPSYWSMVKLEHAWPAGMTIFPAEYVAANGKPPETFDDLADYVHTNAAMLAQKYKWNVKDLLTVMPNCTHVVQGIKDQEVPPVPTTTPPSPEAIAAAERSTTAGAGEGPAPSPRKGGGKGVILALLGLGLGAALYRWRG